MTGDRDTSVRALQIRHVSQRLVAQAQTVDQACPSLLRSRCFMHKCLLPPVHAITIHLA